MRAFGEWLYGTALRQGGRSIEHATLIERTLAAAQVAVVPGSRS